MSNTTRQYRVSLHKLSYKSASMDEIIAPIDVLKETDKCVFTEETTESSRTQFASK